MLSLGLGKTGGILKTGGLIPTLAPLARS